MKEIISRCIDDVRHCMEMYPDDERDLIIRALLAVAQGSLEDVESYCSESVAHTNHGDINEALASELFDALVQLANVSNKKGLDRAVIASVVQKAWQVIARAEGK